MKKQINPTIKAHLIRGAFYLLLLVAVCAIPFALAQRNASKRGVANPANNAKMAAKFVNRLAHHNSEIRNQSLAGARLPVGTSTLEHYYPKS